VIPLSFIALAACIKLLAVTRDPKLSAGVFAASKLVLGFFLGGGFTWLLLSAVIIGALSYLYFWALYRFEGTIMWWVVLVLGVVLTV